MKIQFGIRETSSYCLAPCPFLKNIKAGSMFCCKCEHNKEYNREEQYVICKYGEVEHPHESLKRGVCKTYTITCSNCNRHYSSPITSDLSFNSDDALKHFYNMGWRISKDNDRAICNDCQGEDFED